MEEKAQQDQNRDQNQNQSQEQEQVREREIVKSPSAINEQTNDYDLSKLSLDLKSARIIAPAYSGRNSELAAILQYAYFSIWLEQLGYLNDAKKVMEIGETEMHHLNLLAQTLVRLGVDPIYTAYPPQRDAYFTTRLINYINGDAKRIIEYALKSEKCAISQYQSMISCLTNQEVINILNHIISDENEHIEILNGILSTLN